MSRSRSRSGRRFRPWLSCLLALTVAPPAAADDLWTHPYSNPLGLAAPALRDTTAFATCDR